MKIPFWFLFASILTFSACCADPGDLFWAIDPPEPCGPDISLGALPLTEKTRAALPAFTTGSRLVFVDDHENEQVFSLGEIRESQVHINHKSVCYSALGDQYEYYETQSVQYLFHSGDAVPQNPFINYVLRTEGYGEQLYDGIYVQAHWNAHDYEQMDLVLDDRGFPLDPYVRGLRSNEHELGTVTLLGRTFDNVIFVAQRGNDAYGFYFQYGKGVVAIQRNASELWVLDRIE